MILRTILLAGFGIAFLISERTAPQGLGIGDDATNFSLADVNGKMVSLDSYQDANGYIIVFTCNNCPYAKAYQARLAKLHRDYASKGFPVVAINTSDAQEEIRKRASEKAYPFSYLFDETQEISKSYGATKTPHVYVLNKERKVAYIGAIDNNYKNEADADKKYVRNAVDALLDNREVKVTTTKAIGCSIKWKNS